MGSSQGITKKRMKIHHQSDIASLPPHTRISNEGLAGNQRVEMGRFGMLGGLTCIPLGFEYAEVR